MKHLNDVIQESILDDSDDIVASGEKAMALEQIWKDLTETYGEILIGSKTGQISVKNLDLDKKGRIIFKNWPGPSISFYLGSIDSFPDSVQKRGFGDLPGIREVYIAGPRCKLTELGFNGNYTNSSLEIKQGRIEMDVFPKFSNISFEDSYFKNIHLFPKRQPKQCKIRFSNSSVDNIFSCWAEHFFKGNYPRWDNNAGQNIVC